MSYTVASHDVNAKRPILDVSLNNIPTVVSPDGLTVNLPDNVWSRWYIKTHFEHINATEKGAAWYLKHDPMQWEFIPLLKGKPRPYQVLTVNRMKLSNCALFLDMGLGKTFAMIAFSLWHYYKSQNPLTLVLCPPSVFVTWLDDVAKFTENGEVVIAHGPKKEKLLARLRAEPITRPTFVVTTYETLEAIREKLESMNIGTVHFDESSRIKNMESKRTQSAHALINNLKNPRRFVSSGTPSTKEVTGLYSQFEILGKGFSGFPAYHSFEARYVVSRKFATVKLPHGKVTTFDMTAPDACNQWLCENCPPGSSKTYFQQGTQISMYPKAGDIRLLNVFSRATKFINKEELHGTVQTHAYTLKKEEVLAELPPKTRIKRFVDMSAEQSKAYFQIAETCRATINGQYINFRDKTSPHMKLMQIANGFIKTQDGPPVFFDSQPKLKELFNIIEENDNEKLVIWSPFLDQMDITMAYLKKQGYDAVLMRGDTNINDRPKIVHSFQDPKGAQFLVANPEVGGLGLNLVSAATQIFLANWYKPDTRSQAEDRLWRMGQERPVFCIDLLTSGTLEGRILRTVLGEIKAEDVLLSMSVLHGAVN